MVNVQLTVITVAGSEGGRNGGQSSDVVKPVQVGLVGVGGRVAVGGVRRAASSRVEDSFGWVVCAGRILNVYWVSR